MIVACATDQNYVEMTGVMLRSVIDRGEIPAAKILVLGRYLSDRDEQNLRACVSGSEIQFIDIAEPLKSLSSLPERIWPHTTYGRLFAPDLISDVGRMLYLDSDTIVNRSLRELLDFSMQGHAIAAVPDGTREVAHLPRDPTIEGFNAGVLLFDLDEWRRRGLSKKILRWPFDNLAIMKYNDMDALNGVIGGNYAHLGPGYNLQSERGGRRNAIPFEEAYIIHFTGETKPNMKECKHPAREIFLDSRSRTPWANVELHAKKRRRHRLLRRAMRLFSAFG